MSLARQRYQAIGRGRPFGRDWGGAESQIRGY